ncbi:MAG: AAA family ATPase, partial [Duodenibacillus sp.]|nr:AAA family ATPase [Duodenibacillus sp.]
MLLSLMLRDFVIVPMLEIDAEKGLTCLTGETGAGKSILIDALELALGARSDAGVIREGARRAEVCATFQLSARARAWMEAA